jgi:hypothetical protein
VLVHYFRSVQRFNILFSVVTGVFSYVGGGRSITLFLSTFWLSLFSGGFLLALFFYDLRYKQQYYFYYNKGFSKRRLIVLSYLLLLPFLAAYMIFKKLIGL